MTKKNNKKDDAKAMFQVLKALRAVARKVEEGQLIVPEDIKDDPTEILVFMREEERRSKRAKKWE